MSSFLTKAQMLAQAAPAQAMPLVGLDGAPAPQVPVDGLPQSLLPDYGASYLPNGGQPPAEELAPARPQPQTLQSRLQTLFGQAQSDRAQQKQAGMEMNQELDANQANQEQAAVSTRENVKDRAKMEQPVWKDVEAAGAELQRATQEIQLKAQSATAKQMETYQAAVQNASTTRITDWWGEASTGAKVLGVLSQMLSGAANSLGGNPGAPTALDRIIAQDIQRQTLNMNQANQNAQNQKSLLQEVYQQTGNLMSAQAAVYETALRSADARMKTIANRMATPEAQAAYEATHANIEAKIIAARQGLSQQLYTSNNANLNTQMGLTDLQSRFQTVALKASEDDKVIKRQNMLQERRVQDAVGLLDRMVKGESANTSADMATFVDLYNKAITQANKAPSEAQVKLIRDSVGGFRLTIPGVGTIQRPSKDQLQMLRQTLLETLDAGQGMTGKMTGEDMANRVAGGE